MIYDYYYLILLNNPKGLETYPKRGKPTRLPPIPNPAPVLADTAILGTYVSRMLKVAAAVKAIRATSSTLSDLLGIA